MALMTCQLQLVSRRTFDSKMKPNLQKFSIMWFKGSSRKKLMYPNIFVNDIVLRKVDKQKYLWCAVFLIPGYPGFTKCLMFAKMACYLYLIKSHGHCLSSHLLMLFLELLVLSHLSHALPVWGPSLNQQLLQHLERSQNHTVRLRKNFSRFEHVCNHYRSLSWLPFQQLIQFRSHSETS